MPISSGNFARHFCAVIFAPIHHHHSSLQPNLCTGIFKREFLELSDNSCHVFRT